MGEGGGVVERKDYGNLLFKTLISNICLSVFSHLCGQLEGGGLLEGPGSRREHLDTEVDVQRDLAAVSYVLAEVLV